MKATALALGTGAFALAAALGPTRALRASVSGNCDPGYGTTSRMLGEAALTLAHDRPAGQGRGGIWTPATALGEALLERLGRHAGMKFELHDAG